jgi:hypothetical protein
MFISPVTSSISVFDNDSNDMSAIKNETTDKRSSENQNRNMVEEIKKGIGM